MRGEVGSKRVEAMMSGGIRSVGCVFSNCHIILVLLDVGNSVSEMV